MRPRVGRKKKKKKKSSTSQKVRDREDEAALGGGSGSERADSGRDEAGSSSGAASSGVGKTEAQRRFEEVQRKRVRCCGVLPSRLLPAGADRLSRVQLLEKAAKAAAKSHKERVAEFNEKLEQMSEHYDIPKVGTFSLACPPTALLADALLVVQVGPG